MILKTWQMKKEIPTVPECRRSVPQLPRISLI
jgi:hypothetical protein